MNHSIILAHAPGDAARAAEIALALAAYGYDVEASAKPRRDGKLVLLWSAAAARSLALRAAARRAERQGRALIVRLDAAKAPASLGGARAIKLTNGVGDAALWARALAAESQPQQMSALGGSRASGLGAALVSALAVATALYVSDAAFAAQVDGIAGIAQAQAAEWVGAIKAHVGGQG